MHNFTTFLFISSRGHILYAVWGHFIKNAIYFNSSEKGNTPPHTHTVLKAFVVIKLLLSRGMPVSKFTLKYFNKTISNVYSLSKYSPKALLGQVLCQHGDDEMEPLSPLVAS